MLDLKVTSFFLPNFERHLCKGVVWEERLKKVGPGVNDKCIRVGGV